MPKTVSRRREETGLVGTKDRRAAEGSLEQDSAVEPQSLREGTKLFSGAVQHARINFKQHDADDAAWLVSC